MDCVPHWIRVFQSDYYLIVRLHVNVGNVSEDCIDSKDTGSHVCFQKVREARECRGGGQLNSCAESTWHLHNVHCAHVHIILGMKNKIHGSGASDIIKLITLINILMTTGLVGWVAQCSHC